MKEILRRLTLILCIMLLVIPVQYIKVWAAEIGDAIYLERGEQGFYTIQYKSKESGEWYYVMYNRTWYKDKDGNKKLAYCINPDLIGIEYINGSKDGYYVDLEKVLSDERLWRVYRNGYPYVSKEKLGVETEDDAYLATKQAGYWIIRGYKLEDIRSYFRPGETEINGQNLEDIQRRGRKVIDAIYNLVDLGYNGKETPEYNNLLKVERSGPIIEDDDFLSQTYSVVSKTEIEGYTVNEISDFPNGSYVTDINGNKKQSFLKNEKFKVIIPKKNVKENITGNIKIQSRYKNYPVYYGKARSGNLQDYAIMVDKYSELNSQTKLKIDAYKSSIKIVKSDAETKEKLEGIKFNFKYEDGTNIGDYVTDVNGEIKLNKLKPGKIIITELATKEKYILNKKSENVILGYAENKNIEINNERRKGNVSIYKVDADNNKIGIEGVEFELYSHEENKTVGRYVTDKDGKINIQGLNIGEYSIIEKKTNQWYNLSESKDVIVKWDQNVDITIENELKKGQIKVIKVDKDNHEIKLSGVKFQILDEKDNILETITTNKDGEAYTNKYALRDYKTLYIKEVETNKNYVLDSNIHKIELAEDEIKNIIIENEEIKGRIKILKIAGQDNIITKERKGTRLSGVKFGIYDENKKIIEEITTNEKGEAYTSMLKKGKKYVKELQSKQWYLLDEKEYSVVISKPGETKELTLRNTPETPEINIKKSGKGRAKVGEEIKYSFDIKNTGNVKIEKFTWYEYLPTDYVKISKFSTGTYNQDLKYNIYYKTNKSQEYRLLKEKLDTNINNYIDLTQIELEDDEKIIELKCDFGGVDIGFKSIISPYIIANIRQDLENGDVFINKTEITGYHNTYKASDKDECITEIYRRDEQIKKLPRTGK